ncbi:MAG TPA: hypothetical protein VFS67_23640 [Polyangiaceae bacterium]|nr:hypothetical protein [Polyangiaceae bacterium]
MRPGAVPSVFPSASALAPELVELGPLRNGLGSVRNLQLILSSIKVGQKGLFSAVAAVHEDCDEMIGSLGALNEALVRRGTTPEAAQPIVEALRSTLTRLQSALRRAVESGRLSAARRLALEQALPGLVDELSGTLPLVGLLDRAARPRPIDATPVEWIHSSSSEAAGAEAIPAIFVAPADVPEGGLSVDLAAAKTLLVLGVALVARRSAARPLQVRYVARRGVAAQTWIGFHTQSTMGTAVQIAALPLVEATLPCAEVAARRLGGSFEFSPEPLRVCISWPLS